MNNNDKASLIAVKMPKECVGFVEQNPNVSQAVGKLLASIQQIKALQDSMKEAQEKAMQLLDKPEAFKGALSGGTLEDLAFFLKAVKSSIQAETVQSFHDLSSDDVQAIQKEAAAKGVQTRFTVLEPSEDIVNPTLN